MRLSSSLISAKESEEVVSTWDPSKFQANEPSPAQTTPKADPGQHFEPFTPHPVAVKGANADPPPPDVNPEIPADEQKEVMPWSPGEMKPIPKKIPETNPGEEEANAPAPEPQGPTLDEIKNKLLQETMTEAGNILHQAQLQAVEIVTTAENKAQEILNFAYERGWDNARGETAPMISAAHEIVNQVQAWSDEMYASSQTAVFNLIQEIAQSIFSEGMVLDHELLQRTFNRILSNARSLGDLRVYVNPTDAVNLGPQWREYQETILGQKIEIIPSDSITPGGCFVDGQMGTVDGRVETQYQTVINALSSAMLDKVDEA